MSASRDDWESALDEIDWSEILEEVDGELLENLATELKFPAYEQLKQAAESLGEGYFLIHLADGRWAFWNEGNYVQEDVRYFETGQHFFHFVVEEFNFDEEQLQALLQIVEAAPQMKECSYCGFHFDPEDSARKELGIEGIYLDEERKEVEFCSPQCAVEAAVEEMRDG
ncbi:hypothetical protein [Paludifilum halophilum]|uniref:Uncharacterized protein n=1 Tax=Paludifilum halophilum TaxID=1642702 RepID=A0A235B700_9BACL|nr:hypothetical protein [Paludifilum halophilum]OYD07657.1 hypothetical protein CHM34_09250 [Paludifilum halophilum]